MCRNELITEIKSKYLENRQQVHSWDKSCTKLKMYKNGVYTFCDDSDTVLYIGMVSDAKTASLYARLYSNGNASHQRKTWFGNIAKIYFYGLPTAEKSDIMILERILIREFNPIHNDLDFEDEEIQNVLKKM